MEPNNLCIHRHRLGFRAYLAGFAPIGIKTCDRCGNKVHLDGFWRVVYILTALIGPSPLILILIFGSLGRLFSTIPFFACLLILLFSYCIQFGVSWLVTRYGRYILSKKQKQTDKTAA